MIRHAWLQKHASPTASDGAFHWHPAGGDRELQARLVERARGLEPPAVLWELAPGRLVWAQVFAATAPHDRRRYAGLVLAIVEQPGASTTALLDALTLPAAAPWPDDTARVGRARANAMSAPFAEAAASVADRADAPVDAELRELSPMLLAPLVRSLLDGADVRTALATSVFSSLPAAVRAVEQVMPEAARAHVRRGAWFSAEDADRGASAVGAVTNAIAEVGDPVALLVARACLAPGARAACAWSMLGELAASSGRSVDEVGADVWSAREDLASSLHAWGRDRSETHAVGVVARGGDPAVARRHADALVAHVVQRLAADRDPAPVVAAARWHALLPADRRALLFELAVRRCPSMRALVGGAMNGGVHA